MNGGTFAEARKVGFNAEQAGFFATFGSEIRDEATVQALLKIQTEVKSQGFRSRFSRGLARWAKNFEARYA